MEETLANHEAGRGTASPPTGASPIAAATPAPPVVAPPAAASLHERRRRSVGWRSRDVVRAAALVVGMYIALRLLWFAHPLVLVSFLGVLFGLAVTAGVDRLEGWRIPRGIGAPLIVFGTIALIVSFGASTAPTLRAQSTELRAKLPEAIDKFDAWLDAHRGGLLGLLIGDQSSPATSQPGDAASAPDQPTAAPGDSMPQRTVTQGGGRLRAQLFSQLSGARRYFFPFVTSTFAVVGGLLLVLFLSIYVAVDPTLYHDGLMHLFPHRARRRAGEVLTAMATALRKWLLTQLIAMVAIGAVTTAVLLLLQVKAAVPLGIMAGLLEFIPTIGPILSAIPAIAMAFVDSPEKALSVAGAYVAIQFLENHILIPLLMKEGVDLPPALTIIAQALMALVFGFLGLLVAVPALAATVVAVKMLYVEGVVGDPAVVPPPPDSPPPKR